MRKEEQACTLGIDCLLRLFLGSLAVSISSVE
jgi:hypothetical protein